MTASNLIQRFGLGNNQRFPTLHNPSPSTNIYICKRDLKSLTLTSKQNSLKTVQSNFSHRIIIHLPKDLSTVFGAWFLDIEIHSFNAKSWSHNTGWIIWVSLFLTFALNVLKTPQDAYFHALWLCSPLQHFWVEIPEKISSSFVLTW